MVLSILAHSIRRLIRRIRAEALASRRRQNSAVSTPDPQRATAGMMSAIEDERGGAMVASAAAERERGEQQRGTGSGGFMSAARMATQQPTLVSRSASSKRKLDELEVGLPESSASANSSQVRARREAREDGLESSSVAGSSGRERYACVSVSGEAQALDGESQMREEGGNEAVDAMAMSEDEPGWNKTGGETTTTTKIGLLSAAEENVDGLIAGGGAGGAGGSEGPLMMMVLSETGRSMGGSCSAPSQADSAGAGYSAAGMLPTGFAQGAGNSGSATASESQATLDAGHVAVRGGALEDQQRVAAAKDEESLKEAAELDELRSRGASGSDASCSLSRPAVVDTVDRPCRLQFFIRTYIDRRTVVLQANASDSVESVHQQILLKTGLPVSEQRLLFGGRQLQHDQTLDSCCIGNDATLNLVARMRSTPLPHSWQLMNDLVSTIRTMCESARNNPTVPHPRLMYLQDCVRAGVQEFLKMASKSVSVSEHIQVFQLAGATSALVILLFSGVETNRECAEESISNFLNPNDEYLPSHIHCHCAPVLLDFCKLLNKSSQESLYSSCRNALARLLDTVGDAHGSPYFYDAKAESIVHDFSPFVHELSDRLSGHLRGIARGYVKEASLKSADAKEESAKFADAKDFTAFVIPLCKAMDVCKGVDASWSLSPGRGSDAGVHANDDDDCEQQVAGDDISDYFNPDVYPGLEVAGSARREPAGDSKSSRKFLPGVEVGTHGWLRGLFLHLLDDIDNCLKVVARAAEKSLQTQGPGFSDDRERQLGWAPCLGVLRGLHAIARLYDGAMADLLHVLGKRRRALNVLIRQSKWQDDDFWLLEYKDLLDFESRRRLAMAMLPEPQDDHDERVELVVHRSQLLTESFESLAYVEAEGVQGGISVEFATEEATGPGVLREWFSMICREIFNCQNALFLPCPNDRRRFFPNPASGVNPGHLTYFRFCGRVIALALMHRVQVDVVFAVTFFKQMAGYPISWEDARDADPVLYESCKKILEMDPETIDSDALGLTFVSEVEELGTRKTLELCQGGKDMVVNSQNRRQFVELLVQRRLVASVADQIKSFAQGFSDLLVNATHGLFLRALDPNDLDLLLYGKDRDVCLEDWRTHTEYHDYVVTDLQVVWFWQVVEAMTPEQRRRLLFFSTSVTHLPAEGFSGLSSKFHIHKAHTDTSWLPTAHTCFHQLVLPAYPTYDVMQKRLHAITEEHIAEGFGFA